jgi:peptidoglycan/LPS O-acetylase OafA/YrhL
MADSDFRVMPLPTRALAAARSAVRPARARDATLAYRPDIDGLRALAVGLVVAYHAFPEIRTAGFIGVDIFFVISGYLITGIILGGLQAGTFSLSAFYARRVRRIVPALLVILAACGLLGWLTLFPEELRQLGRSIAWCAPFLANMFFARTGTGYFDRGMESTPLLHLWSLGVEEQFYFAWPVLMMLVVQQGVTMRALIAVTAVSLAVSIWGVWHAPLQYFYLPASRAWELAAGAMLAAWRANSPAPARSLAATGSLAGTLLIAAIVVLFDAASAPSVIASVVATAGAALLIWAGPLAPVNRQILASPPMRFIGRISYPLYLWHWPLFSFAQIILGHAPEPALAGCLILFATAAAYATCRWVEAPIRYRKGDRRTVAGLLLGLAVFALAGAAAGAGAIPGRLSGPAFTAWQQAIGDWGYPGAADLGEQAGSAPLMSAGQAERKVLFIGDSHIQQYWPRVTRVIDARGAAARAALFATYLGCPPLPGINSLERGHNCAGFLDYALQQAYRADVDTVVFGAFWEKYLLGEYSIANSVARICRVDDPARAPLRLDSPGTQIMFDEFETMVARLVASGRRVFIVLSNPTSPMFDPVNMLPSALRLSPHVPASLALSGGPPVDAAAFESFVAPLSSRLRAIAARTGASAIDPRASLCDAMLCPAAGADGMPLYIDSNHLRARFARERASFVDDMLLAPPVQ